MLGPSDRIIIQPRRPAGRCSVSVKPSTVYMLCPSVMRLRVSCGYTCFWWNYVVLEASGGRTEDRNSVDVPSALSVMGLAVKCIE